MTELAIRSNPLRLTHCMRCGYSLETLAPEGTCPECGISYDQGTVVLNGMWAGNGGAATGSPGAAAVAVGLMCLWFLLGRARHRSEHYFNAIVSILVVSAVLAVELAFRFTARRATDSGALLQCRFNRYGCLQCDLPEETTGALDIRRLLRGGGLLAVIAIACLFLHSWLLAAGIAVGLLIELWIRWRRRNAIRSAQHDPGARALMLAARDGGRQVLPTPWSAISRISVGQFRGKPLRARPNRYYLKSITSARHIQPRSAIDAEVEATAEQIRELQARIAAWKLSESARENVELNSLRG